MTNTPGQVAPDPGMAVKMNDLAFAGLADLMAGGLADESHLGEMIAFVDARHDCADFRVASLLKVRLVAYDRLSEPMRAELDRCLLGFKYWLDEPGHDSMCTWSENHQALFAVCEYLAGQTYADEVFPNSFLRGADHRAKAEVRLRRWLEHRFRFGFTEWLSNTYYEEDVAALALLVEHATDADLAQRGAMVLDLLLLDMAMHRFEGRFVASAGRAYEEQKKDPARADVNDILAHAFGEPTDERAYHLERLSSLFVLAERYRVPEALREIAAATGTQRIKVSHGLDLHEVKGHFADPMDVETTGMFFWLMEAFTTPESIDVTMKAFSQYDLAQNRFLSPLAPFAKLRKTRALPLLVRALNPATQGVAIQRANVQTYRTDHYLLSSAQRYHPGGFGDQQHIWQASLPGGINVFATHPGAPMFDETARSFSPSWWVGNGINPDVAQDDNVLLALYDTRARRGYLERGRQQLAHLHFPFARFAETRLGETFVAGRAGDAFIGVRSTGRLEMTDDAELVQRGPVTGYGVVLADRSEFNSLHAFVDQLKQLPLRYDKGILRFTTPDAHYALSQHGAFTIDAQQVSVDYPRFATPWVQAERDPRRLEITGSGHRLVLDWEQGLREESAC